MRALSLTLLNSKGPGTLGFLPISCILLLGNLMLGHDLEQKWMFKSVLSTVLSLSWALSQGIFRDRYRHSQLTDEKTEVPSGSVTCLTVINHGAGNQTWVILTPQLELLNTEPPMGLRVILPLKALRPSATNRS